MASTITVTEALQASNTILFDTRSPKEFAEDHLPNSINVPILNNEERAIVGTLYKQVSQDVAIEKGMEFFGKNLPSIINAANQHKDKTMIIYCWRGGLRSKTVTSLLESLNYKVLQLEGGYKAYRAYVKWQLDKYVLKPKLIVLYGRTGTGKTLLLKGFHNSIDLEALAGHRGSMYGGIGMAQNTQKKFENLLLQELERLKDEKCIFVEGESKRIGNVFVPESFFNAMEDGIKISVECSMAKRVELSAKEYCNTEEKINDFKEITKTIRQKLSNNIKQEIIALLEERNIEKALTLLFSEYYDPQYDYYLKNLKYDLIVNNDDSEKTLSEITEFVEKKI